MGFPAESSASPVTRPWVPACAGRAVIRIARAAESRRSVFIVASNERGSNAATPQISGNSSGNVGSLSFLVSRFPLPVLRFPPYAERLTAPCRLPRPLRSLRHRFEDFLDQGVLAHGHDVDAPREAGDRGRELAGDRKTLGLLVLGAAVGCGAHPFLDLLRNDDSGHFVREEKGLLEGPKRDEPDEERDGTGLFAGE